MILDLTTRNNIYFPVGVQGQWYRHRWGRRNYPLTELTLDQLELCVANSDGFIDIPLSYGDVSQYSHFDTLSRLGFNNLHMNTYGMFSSKQINTINSNFNFVTIHVDGWDDTLGKVFLGADFATIHNSILSLNSIDLTYHCYQHNIKSIKAFCEFCNEHGITAKFASGLVHNGENSHPVIDQQCNWLYDIHGYTVSNDQPLSGDQLDDFANSVVIDHDYTLHKSLYTYNSLRTYVKPNSGRRFTEQPIIPKIFPSTELYNSLLEQNFTDTNLYVAPTGHVFKSAQMGSTFMLFLGDDWDFDVKLINQYDEFRIFLLFCAQELLKYKIDNHTIELVFKYPQK